MATEDPRKKEPPMTLPSAIIVSCQADNPLRSFFIHFSPIFFMMSPLLFAQMGKEYFFQKVVKYKQKADLTFSQLSPIFAFPVRLSFALPLHPH